jgi:hypothetical protein
MFSKNNFIYCFSLLFIGMLFFTGCEGVTPTAPTIDSFSADINLITEGASSTPHFYYLKVIMQINQ